MAKSHPIIPPFPADIDRDRFGDWLSGFTDGEGHFGLAIFHRKSGCRDTGSAKFVIKLRQDDAEILRTIQSFWQCGVVWENQAQSSGRPGKPQCHLQIARLSDLERVIIPHFDRFPLRAKKARDFVLWRRGVELCYAIKRRKRRRVVVGYGTYPKWTADEKAEFVVLYQSLHRLRAYKGKLEMPPPIKDSRQQTLW